MFQLLRDKQLLFIVGALLAVDFLVLLIWGVVDPMQKHVTNLTMEVGNKTHSYLKNAHLIGTRTHARKQNKHTYTWVHWVTWLKV